jgi:hypothetical protein
MHPQETRLIPAKKRLSGGNRQLRFEMCSNEAQSIGRTNLNCDIKESALDQGSLPVEIKFDALLRMSLYDFKPT